MKVHMRAIIAAGAAIALVGIYAASPVELPAYAAELDASGAQPDRTLQQFAAADTGADAATSIFAGVPPVEELVPPKPIALYSLAQFMTSGVIQWGGYKFTYYSQQVLPGPGLAIPGRHVNDGGYVSDADGYIVLAGSAPKGTVYETPFGYPGKIYDRGTTGNHLDVYIR